ncbi:MAG: protein kinase [Deltaproteobacteria bacterium]|nr:protein kinase [Deltaproteobacteria bacterium]
MSQAVRDQIADELGVGGTPDQIARVRKVARTVGNIADQLVALGFGAQDVLQACCAVTGLPPAPMAWLRQPKLAEAAGLDLDQCRRIGAVPLQGPANRLCLVFGDPEVGAESATFGLPPHHAYLALSADLARATALLPRLAEEDEPATTVGGPRSHTDPEPRTAAAPPPTASADPLDVEPADGATIMMTTVPEHDGTSESDAGSDSDDMPLFDDPTSAVPAFALPSAPKPGARQQTGAVTGVPVAQLSARPSGDEVATERLPLPQRNRRAPSLATPADGIQQDDLAAKPTVITDAPPAPSPAAPARPSPSDKRAASPAAPPRPSPSGKGAASPSRPSPSGASPAAPAVQRAPTPQKPLTPHKALAPQQPVAAARSPAEGPSGPGQAFEIDDIAPTQLTPPPPSRLSARNQAPVVDKPVAPDTEQRALAALSADDLLDDEASADDLPPLELDWEKAPPRQKPASEPGPPRTVYGEPQAESEAAPADGGSFAAAAEADDQENVAHQKQRMKRIAQIAAVKRYKIDRILGRGGMATVYLATDTRTGRPCALKLMEPHLAEDEVFVERFKREIKASISLSHENIVGVFDFGEENGTYYMASEYVDAGTVGALLKTLDRPLPPALAVPIMMGFLDGLGAAHAQGFVHRDLKPANLMLTSAGVVKIGDFGIAKAQTDSTLTKTGALFGTPAYMSPEQATGQELDGRSDLFAAGIIFYELLAGYNPYAHENPSTTMFAIARGQARPIFDANPTVPGAAEKVVMRLLEKDKSKRYQTAAEARDDLMALADLLQKQHPGAVAAATRDAVGTAAELSKAQAVLEVERAKKLMQKVPPESAEACFRYYKATLLDADSFDAMNGLTQLRAEYGFRFTRPDDKQILELEAALEKKPDQPAVLRRLADLSASHRNLVDMAGFAKRYLRYQAGDTHMQGRLERVIGNDPLAPFSRMAMDNAAKAAQQAVAASDDMRDAARAAAEEQALAARSTPVRPSLRPGSQTNPPRDGAPAAAEPGSLELDDVGPRKSRHAAGGAVLAAGPAEHTTPATVQPAAQPMPEEPELPPPKDSLEAGIRMVRQAWRDTVRSLTGDRGVAAVKQELRARLEDGSREAKEAAKLALQASKEAVKQKVLDEKGRKELQEQVRKHGKIGLQRHWRLALVALVLWGLLIGAGKACHMICFDSSTAVAPVKPAAPAAAAPTPAPAAGPAPGDDDDRGKAKPPVPAEEAPAAPAAPAADAVDATAPAPPPAPATGSKGVDLAKRQEELRQRAKQESDSKRAIDLYTQAVDTDPYSKGARDALLERARLFLAEGDLEQAERDLFALKRRPDVDAVKADLEQMLADLATAKKAAEAPPPPPP